MFNLAVAYSRGDGTAVNFTEATKWYQRAADMGHTMATWTTWEVIHVSNQVDDMTLAVKGFRDAGICWLRPSTT